MRGETGLKGSQVEGSVVLVNLDRVAAAKGDVGTEAAGEVEKAAEITDLAAGARCGGGDLGMIQASGGCGLPELKGDEGAAKEVMLAGEDLEGFGDLQGGGEIDGGGEDAGGIAGLDGAGWRMGEDTGEAGGGGIRDGGGGSCVAALRRERRDAGACCFAPNDS